jgi:hypothetical protein
VKPIVVSVAHENGHRRGSRARRRAESASCSLAQAPIGALGDHLLGDLALAAHRIGGDHTVTLATTTPAVEHHRDLVRFVAKLAETQPGIGR